MYFGSDGPYNIPKIRNGQWRKKVWNSVEQEFAGMSEGIGCYLYATQFGNNKPIPWYVGMTLCQAGFAGEVFQAPHKTSILDRIQKSRPNCQLKLFLFPLVTETFEKLSKNRTSSERTIQWLERTLIGMATAKNPDCINVKDTTEHRNIQVAGLLGSKGRGRPLAQYITLQSMFK
jgi:hypothetical protein